MLATFFVLLSITGLGNAAEVFVQEGDSIQEAVNSAVSGDAIIVKPGTYKENILVTKDGLSISSQSGDPKDTIIEPYDLNADVLRVEADNITVKGFTITGAGANCSGVYLNQSKNCLIENNRFTDNSYGVNLYSSLKNSILNNVVSNCDIGIYIEKSNYNSIKSNKVSKCRDGISLLSSKENTVSKNTAKENRDCGILSLSSKSNTYSGNTVSDNHRGIHFGSSDSNTLSENLLIANDVYGLFVCPRSDNNLIYDNFFNNTNNVEANNGTANSYSKPKVKGKNIVGGSYIGGNCWLVPNGTGISETAVDADRDGIADVSYEFETSDYFDPLPLIYHKSPDLILPKANMSINTPEGSAPYSVQFTDLSVNETSRSWDFENDGIIDSSDEMPVYTYPSSGVYFVNLTVGNANGTDIKTITIDVKENEVTEIQFGSGSVEKNTDSTGSQVDKLSGLGSFSSIPGFEMIYGVFGLLFVFLHKKAAK